MAIALRSHTETTNVYKQELILIGRFYCIIALCFTSKCGSRKFHAKTLNAKILTALTDESSEEHAMGASHPSGNFPHNLC